MTNPNPADEGAVGGASQEASPWWRAVLAATTDLAAPHDTVGTLTRLLEGGVAAAGAASAGLVVRRLGREDLELLAWTNHTAAELEFYQVQSQLGPCVDAARDGVSVHAGDPAQIEERWPQLAQPYREAGYHAVLATPVKCGPETIGAFNLFWTRPQRSGDDQEVEFQVLANLAALTIMNSREVSAKQLLERTRAALSERIMLERAKGVIAHVRSISPEEAFEVLRSEAAAGGVPLLSVAEDHLADLSRP